MAHARYFLLTSGLTEGGRVILEGPEFHHLARVARAREGEIVLLLDGAGSIHEARVLSIGPRAASLEIVRAIAAAPLASVDMALGVTKTAALDLAVEKLTEIGVRRILPFVSERSVWRGDRAAASERIERLRRKAAAACKQSGQPYLPEIASIASFEELLGKMPSYGRVFAADPEGAPIAWIPVEERGPVAGPVSAGVLGIVGPEGGLAPVERERLLSAGARPVSLGPFRLRSETAAICLLFCLAAASPASRRSPEEEPRR